MPSAKTAGALADAAEVETDRRHAKVVKRPRERIDHLVIERAAEERMRMTDDAERP